MYNDQNNKLSKFTFSSLPFSVAQHKGLGRDFHYMEFFLLILVKFFNCQHTVIKGVIRKELICCWLNIGLNSDIGGQFVHFFQKHA